MKDLSVEDMSEAAGLTKYHFCRQFLKKTGLKPNQYLRKIRVEQAAWSLRHTDKTVETVARETGFGYTNYFIKVFRSFVGATPQEYRMGSGWTRFTSCGSSLNPGDHGKKPAWLTRICSSVKCRRSCSSTVR
ncbi:helix-turn-helix transcriptional regulator [Paenibacillus sp. P25]|nr:helix-turn-helix transcriptional regulator [Paenibacillus sp. P25]